MNKLKSKIDYRNPKLKSWLRSIQFVLVATLVIVGTVILVYAGQGYDYDRSNGGIIQNGLILVNTAPEGASVTINGNIENDNTPGRFALPAGDYDVNLNLDGYREWSKNVSLVGSSVEWIYYPLLIPDLLVTRNVAVFGGLEFIAQTDNKKSFLIRQSQKEAEFNLLTVSDNKISAEAKLTIPEDLTKLGSIGAFKFEGWAKDNKHALIRHELKNKFEFILIDTGDMAKTKNISSDFDLAFDDVRFIDGDFNKLYVLTGQDLRKIDLNNKTISTPIIKNVSDYAAYEDKFVAFINTNEDQQTQLGLIEGQNEPIIVEKLSKNPQFYHHEFMEFDKNFYLSLLDTSGGNLTVYINPQDKPVLGQQLERINLVVKDANNLVVSNNNQFIAVQSGKQFGVYDIDRDKKYKFTLSFEPAKSQVFAWLDGYRMFLNDQDGYVRTFEFDGANQQKLLFTNPAFKIFIDSSSENIYSVMKGGGSHDSFLQDTSLKVDEVN